MSGLLNWDGADSGTAADYSLRDVIDNMRKLGALVEIAGTVVATADNARYDEATAEELMLEAGGLIERLGVRALELLDAEAAPEAPTPVDELAARRDGEGLKGGA